jgi:hypothetical protein
MGLLLSNPGGTNAAGALSVYGFLNASGTTPNAVASLPASCNATAQQIAFFPSSSVQGPVPVFGQSGASFQSVNIGGESTNIVTTVLGTSGSDSVDCANGGFQKITLSTNETLTLACSLPAAPATLFPTPTPTPAVPATMQRFELLVCQDSTGGHTLTFNNSNIRWSNATQPGYTLTAGNGDRYFFEWDGVNFRELGFESNVQCS